MMNELREELLSKVIRCFGFEHPQTISFARKCEEFPEGSAFDKVLINFCNIVLNSIKEEDE